MFQDAKYREQYEKNKGRNTFNLDASEFQVKVRHSFFSDFFRFQLKEMAFLTIEVPNYRLIAYLAGFLMNFE